MTWLLNGIYLALLLLASPWILWRRVVHGRYRRGGAAKWWGQLPLMSQEDGAGPVVWLHAVSVGELQVLRPIVELAQRQRPDLRLLITTSTDAGFELASRLYSQHTVSYAPLDFSWAVHRGLNRVNPVLLVFAELEFWPNWLRAAQRRGIPVAILNGRLSQSSWSGYRRLRWLVQSRFRSLRWVGAQNDTYRGRFVDLGCVAERVVVTGNIKFDGANPDREHPEVVRRRELLGLTPNDSVWLCGSTQSPEEQLCIDAYRSVADRYPELRLLLVPRHPERFDEVAQAVAETGMPWFRRSELGDASPPPDWRIGLADTIGELRWWWGVADLGFVGGSFGSRGGQNMIEPCAYGVATCFGPNTRNFSDIVGLLLDADAAMQLTGPESLGPWVIEMLERPERREMLADHARCVTAAHRGAVARTWCALESLLAPAKAPRS